MRKIVLTLMMTLLAAGLQAQHLTPSKILDNWYVGANMGINSKVTHNDFMSNVNPSAALRLGRDFNPYVGVMFEGTAFFNDLRFGMSKTMVKAVNYDLLATVNLSNLISGFKGNQRFFETRVLAGVGFNHIYGLQTENNNDFITKLGLDLVFHVNSLDALEFYLSPAINFNMDHYSERTQFNMNYAAWQLSAGVNYRFKNSNGTRYFTFAPTELYDSGERNKLNRDVNELRAQNKEDQSAQRVEPLSTGSLPSIAFEPGSDRVEESQYERVATVASYLREHLGALLVIQGPMGRITAVRTMLLRLYGLESDRLLLLPDDGATIVTFKVR